VGALLSQTARSIREAIEELLPYSPGIEVTLKLSGRNSTVWRIEVGNAEQDAPHYLLYRIADPLITSALQEDGLDWQVQPGDELWGYGYPPLANEFGGYKLLRDGKVVEQRNYNPFPGEPQS